MAVTDSGPGRMRDTLFPGAVGNHGAWAGAVAEDGEPVAPGMEAEASAWRHRTTG